MTDTQTQDGNEVAEEASAIRDALDEARWWEIRLTCKPSEFYKYLRAKKPGTFLMYHHFYEPWHPGGAVARLLILPEYEDEVVDFIEGMKAQDGIERWQREEDDRKLYGKDFDTAMTFFYASSDLADRGEEMTWKLFHCLLNAHGYRVKDERKLAAKIWWNRLTIKLRLRWRSFRSGREWWE